MEGQNGALEGVEAVIDKDLAAALLARELGAEVLLLLTDVPAVQVGWGTPEATELRSATPEQIRGLGLEGGSMGPKAEAAARFAEGGGRAVIAALDGAADALAGGSGTVVELPRCPQASVDERGQRLGDLDRGQRPEAQRPATVELLAKGVLHAMAFELGDVGVGALVARGALEGRVEAVAAIVHRPDRQPIGYRSGLHG